MKMNRAQVFFSFFGFRLKMSSPSPAERLDRFVNNDTLLPENFIFFLGCTDA
jgi:hypothetical protein